MNPSSAMALASKMLGHCALATWPDSTNNAPARPMGAGLRKVSIARRVMFMAGLLRCSMVTGRRTIACRQRFHIPKCLGQRPHSITACFGYTHMRVSINIAFKFMHLLDKRLDEIVTVARQQTQLFCRDDKILRRRLWRSQNRFGHHRDG